MSVHRGDQTKNKRISKGKRRKKATTGTTGKNEQRQAREKMNRDKQGKK